MIFVLGVGFFFFFSMDDLAFNDMTLILSVNMDVNLSIETHGIWQTINFFWQESDKWTYLKFGHNLRVIFLKLET